MTVIDQAYDLVAPEALTPHPSNPRRGDVPLIRESVRANGFYGAIIAQRSTSYVLAGNHRLEAAIQEGLAEVPVVWVDVDDDTARRILLVDNRSNDLAGYDGAKLLDILQGLTDLTGTGYVDDDVDRLTAQPEDLANFKDPAPKDDPASGSERPAVSHHCPKCGVDFTT